VEPSSCNQSDAPSEPGHRTKEAFDALLPVADKFPEQWLIPYNLSCYCCQLGRLDEAREWFHRALTLGDENAIKRAALNDPDPAPLMDTPDR